MKTIILKIMKATPLVTINKRSSITIRSLLLFVVFTVMTSTNLYALSIGDAQLKSTLGAPLLVKVPLQNVGNLHKEEIHIKQASLDDYESLGVNRNALYKTLLFDIDDNNIVTISSRLPIKEPYLHFVIQFRWPKGELLREVKLLLNPPAEVN